MDEEGSAVSGFGGRQFRVGAVYQIRGGARLDPVSHRSDALRSLLSDKTQRHCAPILRPNDRWARFVVLDGRRGSTSPH